MYMYEWGTGSNNVKIKKAVRPAKPGRTTFGKYL
jgi:hypothetical protein